MNRRLSRSEQLFMMMNVVVIVIGAVLLAMADF
jgi:hypothetical protein